MIDAYYMNPEGRAAVKAAAKAMKDELAARRLLRATALDLDLRKPAVERRSANGDRRTVDRRGAHTVEIGGQIVIRPRSDLARFDQHPADVSAFMLDDAFRNGAGS